MLPDLRRQLDVPASEPRKLAILGSTGSIGVQTLEVAALFPDRLKVDALVAGSDWKALAAQALEVCPRLVVIADEAAVAPLRDALASTTIEVRAGSAAIEAVAAAPEVDVVVAAIVGAAGLRPTLAAARAGKTIALANKESLVVAGALVEEACHKSGAVVIPVDSEHSALFQALLGEPLSTIETLILTASGGPFRQRDAASFADITREEALAHPNWSMGAKVTIDSATLMNKGLEVIEARWLFGIEADRIEVVVHPQSVIHSMVAFCDGSTKAQLGVPTMCVPIQYALTFPDRWPAPHPRLDWTTLGSLDFEAPDLRRFPALGLAFSALRLGGAAPAVLNAANEVAVERFLSGDIRFPDIPRLVETALANAPARAESLDALVAADAEARQRAASVASRWAVPVARSS
ncbi:MAG: 1-deoxy-D-xylulose-5-phosphate reductoisomerase [Rubricoccaceae bacterium]